MFLRIFSAVILLGCAHCLFAKDAIRVETFQGEQIAPYTQEIVRFCDKIYRDYPYLYNGDDAGYESYLESYSNSTDSIICLAFDEEQIIGLAAGMPMTNTRDIYKQTLIDHGYALETLFYLGEFGLEPKYHGQGLEERMYEKIAQFAKQNAEAKTLCLWEIDHSSKKGSKPQGFIPNDSFWKKMAFIRYPDLNFLIYWTNINESEESSHLAVYWMKVLQFDKE